MPDGAPAGARGGARAPPLRPLLLLGDVPEQGDRRLQHALHVLAQCEGPVPLAERDVVGYWVARTWTCSAICFCLAGLVSRAKASRSPSMSLSHGQPNMALSHEALRKPIITGLRMSAATHEVRNAFQPPAVGGSSLARRAPSVRQPIECMSTLKPPVASSDLAPRARLFIT